MAKESGGFIVDLDLVPLKYQGLQPWEIWISESQERMTMAVSDKNKDKVINLLKKRGVEATVIGKFTKIPSSTPTHIAKTITKEKDN